MSHYSTYSGTSVAPVTRPVMDAIRWRECAGRLDPAAIGRAGSQPSAARDQSLQVSELAALHIAEPVVSQAEAGQPASSRWPAGAAAGSWPRVSAGVQPAGSGGSPASLIGNCPAAERPQLMPVPDLCGFRCDSPGRPLGG